MLFIHIYLHTYIIFHTPAPNFRYKMRFKIKMVPIHLTLHCSVKDQN